MIRGRESDRNYGCRIRSDLTYKGYAAVVMENRVFRLQVLPGKGTDIIELLHKPTDVDLSWYTPLGLRRAEPLFTDYQSQYEGGWQEIFPSLSAAFDYEGLAVPRYGEVALVNWDYQVLVDQPECISVEFSYRCRTQPFKIVKTITMNAEQAGFDVFESVSNLTGVTLYADWGHHITWGVPFLVPGTVIDLPDADILRYVTPESGGHEFHWIPCVNEGRYRLTRPDGLGVELTWDAERWPCLWFWREFGDDPSGPYFGASYNVGLEIFTSPPALRMTDNIDKGTALTFRAHESHSSDLHFAVLTGS